MVVCGRGDRTNRKMDKAGRGEKNSATFRRTWDKAYYERKAQERGEEEVEPELNHPAHFQRPLVPRKPLVAREYTVDVESKVGKTQVVTPGTPLAQQAGFYCDICDCIVKDSANYLDHINGKKHQRAMGYSMRTERSTLEQVREKFKQGKRKKEQEEEYNFDEKMERLKQDEDKRKQERKARKKQKKVDAQQNGALETDDLAALGLPTGFGKKQ